MNIRGIEIELHQDEALSNHIRREGDFFEAEILDYLARCCPSHRTILDIGANIGNHAVYFANFLTYETIVCFEPIPANYELLKKNMFRYEGIALYQAAVGALTHQTKMRAQIDNMGASRIDPNGDISVPLMAVDRMALSDVTLMKIDVEGYEPSVLEGASDTIIRSHPLILIEDWDYEYHRLLEPLGYELIEGWPHHRTYLWGPK